MDHRAIIGHWPTLRSFADDIGEKYDTALKWRVRNRIPSEVWPAVVEAAGRRGWEETITEKVLTDSQPMRTGRDAAD